MITPYRAALLLLRERLTHRDRRLAPDVAFALQALREADALLPAGRAGILADLQAKAAAAAEAPGNAFVVADLIEALTTFLNEELYLPPNRMAAEPSDKRGPMKPQPIRKQTQPDPLREVGRQVTARAAAAIRDWRSRHGHAAVFILPAELASLRESTWPAFLDRIADGVSSATATSAARYFQDAFDDPAEHMMREAGAGRKLSAADTFAALIGQ